MNKNSIIKKAPLGNEMSEAGISIVAQWEKGNYFAKFAAFVPAM